MSKLPENRCRQFQDAGGLKTACNQVLKKRTATIEMLQ